MKGRYQNQREIYIDEDWIQSRALLTVYERYRLRYTVNWASRFELPKYEDISAITGYKLFKRFKRTIQDVLFIIKIFNGGIFL